MYISIKSNLSFFFCCLSGSEATRHSWPACLRATRDAPYTRAHHQQNRVVWMLLAFGKRSYLFSCERWQIDSGHNKQQFRLLSTTSTMYTTYIAKFISNSQKAKCEARMQAKETPFVIDKCKFGWPQCAKRWNVGRISTKCLSFVALSGG